jgi:hypothetical protein
MAFVVADQISPDPHAERLRALERELAAACAELEEYQHLIDELPTIYQAKFSSQLRAIAQEIRSLTGERHRLQDQIHHCLRGEVALPPQPARGEFMPSWWAPTQRWISRPPPWQLALAAGASAFAVAVGVGLGWQAPGSRPAPGAPPVSDQPAATGNPASNQPATPQPPQPSAPQLRLRATGEVWLELRSHTHQLLLESTLRPGQETSVPLGQGLRIRSGRPHLLELAQAGQPFAPLAAANDFSWHTIAAPSSGKTPALKPEVTDQAS